MRNGKKTKSLLMGLFAVSLTGAVMTGCTTLGGTLLALPCAKITSIQAFDQPNYTVTFSIESAVSNPSLVSKINWVFGDGTGFVEGPAGRTTTTHRYNATGIYAVTAYVFDQTGTYVFQIDGSTTVVPNGEPGPGPDPTPEGFPGKVTGPNPTDKAENVDVTTTLTWTSAEDAESYDVYLGKVKASVESATITTAAIFRGNQVETKFDPEGLDPDTQYYWRVDSRNTLGVTEGDLYQFKTAVAPKKAKDFQPVDGTTTAPIKQVLQWKAGKNATSHDIYFGKVKADVENATTEDEDVFIGNQTGVTHDPEDEDADEEGDLLPATMYYWRIDEVGPGGTTKGDVLKFQTTNPPAAVTNPIPTDGANNVDTTQNLSWSAVPSIVSFDVYFGLDTVAVGDATRSSPEFKGNQTSKVFNPGDLLGSTTYYWRIDTLGPGGTSKGGVFTFTTAEPPAQVEGPFSPADNATDVDVNDILEWNPGIGGGVLDSFDVFFSTNESAVVNGSASAFQGNQNNLVTTFDPLGMSSDTDYFWRIDAIGPGGTTTGQLLTFHTGALPAPAEFPVPADSAECVALDVLLEWTAGVGATGRNVYLGKNQSAVNNADVFDAEFLGATADTFFDPGLLEGNTQYYWRIDEYSTGGSTKGEIWSFKTAPDPATNPVPLHEETGIELDVTLEWDAGAGAASHNVYFGTVETDVENATPTTPGIFKGNQPGTTFAPQNLIGAETYYWRIDEVGTPTNCVTPGEVWSFTTGAGPAAKPISPDDGDSCVEVEPTLTWNAGVGAVSHDIYFGISETAVEDATRASPQYKGNELLGTETFTPAGPLDGCTAYFWRIDEIDADDNATKGEVWQFQTTVGAASEPVPADLEVGVDVNPILTWTAASGATSYNVYLDTVNPPVALEGNQVGTTFEPDTLTGGETYYWRIDPVGCCTGTGEVWEFTTGPGQATDPDPFDGEAGVDIDPMLSWTPAPLATSQDVYFGTNFAAVEDATHTSGEFQGNQVGSLFFPGPQTGMTFYYWRIDSVTVDGVTMGEVWQFRTGPAKATNPVPNDFADDVALDTLLKWSAGIGATTHDVYFSTSLADVTNGTPAAFRGNVTGTIFDPGALDGDTTYFWRIDEVTSGGSATTEGDVWQFTTELPAPGLADNPNPDDGATSVSTSVTLSWDPPQYATHYAVYLSVDETDVDDLAPTAHLGVTLDPTIEPPPLASGTLYYWRVVSLNALYFTPSNTWQFTTEP